MKVVGLGFKVHSGDIQNMAPLGGTLSTPGRAMTGTMMLTHALNELRSRFQTITGHGFLGVNILGTKM